MRFAHLFSVFRMLETNPQMQQMMQSVMSNPAMMDMALRSNPQMRAMIDANPHMAGMLQNPQFLQVRPHNCCMCLVLNCRICPVVTSMGSP
jgi:hypothetical protein